MTRELLNPLLVSLVIHVSGISPFLTNHPIVSDYTTLETSVSLCIVLSNLYIYLVHSGTSDLMYKPKMSFFLPFRKKKKKKSENPSPSYIGLNGHSCKCD